MALDKNLTGEQIQQVLDLFLYKALEPVVLYSDVFDAQVSYILSLVSANRKRKPSSLPRDRVIEILCTYLTEDDRRRKFELIREARIERSFVHGFISRFLSRNKGFLIAYKKFVAGRGDRLIMRCDLDFEAVRSSCDSRQDLYRIVQLSTSYLSKFYEYKSLVLDHYLKLSSRQAKVFVKSNRSSNIDFHDVRQSILKSISIAIDKYDSNKGALTSYINWWVLNALTCGGSEYEYGIAYLIPQTHKKKLAEKTSGEINFSVSLDDLSGGDDDAPTKSLHSVLGDDNDPADSIERAQMGKIVQYIAKSSDIRGCARLVLDIGEVFSEKELQAMRDHSREEGCA